MTTKYIVNNLSGQTITNEPILRPYKVYTAMLTQNNGIDSGIPQATIFENTIGNIVWSKNGTGDYYGTLTGVFLLNKTWCVINGDYIDPLGFKIMYRNNDNSIGVSTSATSVGIPTDNILYQTYIEIRVYN